MYFSLDKFGFELNALGIEIFIDSKTLIATALILVALRVRKLWRDKNKK